MRERIEPPGGPEAPQFRAPSAPASVSLSPSLWVSKSINNLYHLVHSRRESPYVPVSPYRGPALTRYSPPRLSESATISRYPMHNGYTERRAYGFDANRSVIERDWLRTGANETTTRMWYFSSLYCAIVLFICSFIEEELEVGQNFSY